MNLKYGLAILMAAAIAVGCTDRDYNQLPAPPDAGIKTVTLQLQVEDAYVDTKSPNLFSHHTSALGVDYRVSPFCALSDLTKSVATAPETKIHKVAIYLFNKYDLCIGSFINLVPDADNKVKVVSPEQDVAAVYILANYPGDHPFTDKKTVGNLSELKGYSFDLPYNYTTGQYDVATYGIPMYYETTSLSRINIMTRLMTKVSWDINFNTLRNGIGGDTDNYLEAVSFINVPKSIEWGSIISGSATSTSTLANFTVLPIASAVGGTNTGTTYILENKRGTTANTLENKKANQRNATYMKLLFAKNDAIRFWLGANLTNDFNLVRNTAYALAAKINSLPGQEDLRYSPASPYQNISYDSLILEYEPRFSTSNMYLEMDGFLYPDIPNGGGDSPSMGLLFAGGSLVGVRPNIIKAGEIYGPTVKLPSDFVQYRPTQFTEAINYMTDIPRIKKGAEEPYKTRRESVNMAAWNHDPSKGLGDICKYMSRDVNNYQKIVWRLPTINEYMYYFHQDLYIVATDVKYYGDVGMEYPNSAYYNQGISIMALPAILSFGPNKTTYSILGMSAKSVIDGRIRSKDDSILAENIGVGTTGMLMTGSAGGTRGWISPFQFSAVHYDVYHEYGKYADESIEIMAPVRCVRVF